MRAQRKRALRVVEIDTLLLEPNLKYNVHYSYEMYLIKF